MSIVGWPMKEDLLKGKRIRFLGKFCQNEKEISWTRFYCHVCIFCCRWKSQVLIVALLLSLQVMPITAMMMDMEVIFSDLCNFLLASPRMSNYPVARWSTRTVWTFTEKTTTTKNFLTL